MLAETINQIYNESLYNNYGVDRYSLIFTQLDKEKLSTPPASPISLNTGADQYKNKGIISPSIFLYSYLKHDIGPLLRKSIDSLSAQPTFVVDKFEK
jgi:hypothetical protein